MRKLLLFVVFGFLIPCVAIADWTTDAQLLSLELGAAMPVGKMSVDGTSANNQRLGSTNLTVGGQYLYYVLPQIAFGLDLGYTKFGEKTSANLFGNTDTVSSPKSTVILAVGKFNFASEGRLLPYLLGGLGLHISTLKVDGTPTDGSSWPDTHTLEDRKLVDDTRSNVAAALGVGTDIPLTAHLTAGLEARYIYLATTNFNPTRAGQTAGLTGIHGGTHVIDLIARVGVQF